MTLKSFVTDGEKIYKDISQEDKLIKSPEDFKEVTRQDNYKPTEESKDG